VSFCFLSFPPFSPAFGVFLIECADAKPCCKVLLQGVVARCCCKVFLQSVVAKCCCKVLVSILVCCDVSWHHWDTLTCFFCTFLCDEMKYLCDEMKYHFEGGVRWLRGFKPEAANT